uniref:uncharacterized protein LOC120337198 n=1 Tax=Styela clava TaxID=7725 RepID=UPI00193A96EA|nr:uncharacterized protein LOC120337198 [Styela clava]
MGNASTTSHNESPTSADAQNTGFAGSGESKRQRYELKKMVRERQQLLRETQQLEMGQERGKKEMKELGQKFKGSKVEDSSSEDEILFSVGSPHSLKELKRQIDGLIIVRKLQQLEMRQERRKKEMKKLGQKFEGTKIEVGDSSSEDKSLSSGESSHSLKEFKRALRDRQQLEMGQERRKKEMKKLGQKFEGIKVEVGDSSSEDKSLSSGESSHSLKGLKRQRDDLKRLVRERQHLVREREQLVREIGQEQRKKEMKKLEQKFEGSKVEAGDSSSEDESLFSGGRFFSLKGLKYTRRLQNASSKSEKLKIFTEMHAVGEALGDTIATYVEAIDMSNVALTYTDLQVLGFIINYSTTLSMVNLRNCQLPPGSIAQLGYSIKSNVVINEFNIEKNPNLNVEDLIAGIKLCVREGRECNFICDVSQLGKKDKKVFKAVVLQYTETSPPQSTKSRRALAMESRLQMPQVSVSRYKKRSGKSYSIGFQGKASYSISQLQLSKTVQISADPSAVVGKVNTEKLKEEPLEKSSNANNSTNEYSKQLGMEKKMTKYKPGTVAESVKYRKMQRFQSMLSTVEETRETPYHSKLDKSVKIAALSSDRTRFQALAMKTTKSARLRRHVKDTHSTILSTKKSTNKDSGFRSFSQFGSAASIKSIQRRFSRLNTKEDRSKRSEHSMTDNVNTDSAHGSFGSSEKLDVSRKRNDYDPKMLEWQRFEMTCKYGLGVMQNKTQRLKNG